MLQPQPGTFCAHVLVSGGGLDCLPNISPTIARVSLATSLPHEFSTAEYSALAYPATR